MIIEYGHIPLVVDFECNFIMKESCYEYGHNCFNCQEADSCLEELDAIYEELEKEYA